MASGRGKRKQRLAQFREFLAVIVGKHREPLPTTKQYITEREREINALGAARPQKNNEWRTHLKESATAKPPTEEDAK